MIDINGNDEIAYLSKKFNAMVAKINELINEEYKAKLGEKTARMKALEAQINPHFYIMPCRRSPRRHWFTGSIILTGWCRRWLIFCGIRLGPATK